MIFVQFAVTALFTVLAGVRLAPYSLAAVAVVAAALWLPRLGAELAQRVYRQGHRWPVRPRVTASRLSRLS